MTQYLGFARNHGGDYVVMAWITGDKAKEVDTWLNYDHSGKDNITMPSVPAVLIDSVCPYTANTGRWIQVGLHFDRTTSVKAWADNLHRLLSGQPPVIRTIRATVRNNNTFVPLFFHRNGDLWLSDPKRNSEKPREDIVLLNLIKIADGEAFPEKVQARITDFFPPLTFEAGSSSLPAKVSIKAKEAEDILPTRRGPRINKSLIPKRLKNTSPAPWTRKKLRQVGNQTGIYTINSPRLMLPSLESGDTGAISTLRLISGDTMDIGVDTSDTSTLVPDPQPSSSVPDTSKKPEDKVRVVEAPPQPSTQVVESTPKSSPQESTSSPTQLWDTVSSGSLGSSISLTCHSDIDRLLSGNGHNTSSSGSSLGQPRIKTPLSMVRREQQDASSSASQPAASDLYTGPCVKLFNVSPVASSSPNTTTDDSSMSPVEDPKPSQQETLPGPSSAVTPSIPIPTTRGTKRPASRTMSPLVAPPHLLGLGINLPSQRAVPLPWIETNPEVYKKETLPVPASGPGNLDVSMEADPASPDRSVPSIPPCEEIETPESITLDTPDVSIPESEMDFVEDPNASPPKDPKEGGTKKE